MSPPAFDPIGAPGVRAFLGPTNTGKTHRAIQRMLQHPSGMIGLPLRLLAQEVYDKVVAAKGEHAVALVTGEQKRIPSRPRYWVCTVESMPMARPVSFLAVDEIQLAASPNRGHVFTDRLLHARGVRETIFLGSDAIEPLMKALVPTVEVERFERLSTLSGAGARSIGSLPKRSALVAFSANDVYELAERVRRRHGGAAVVLGALSPRARNAQVALYQAGEVQHMVATDAIGMGLNMDLDHVCFSDVRKFDGRRFRDLTPAELAQIAGRAGRFRRDGSFSTLNHLGPLPPEVVDAIEQHRFAPETKLYWRSSDLDFRSVDALLGSLEAAPRHPALIQVRDWSDHETLRALAQDAELRGLLRGEEAVRLAWEVCQIPDFRKTLTGAHVGLLTQLLRYLLGPARRLPEDWVRGRIDKLDREEGDIDALMTRIAWIRTWNYISFHPRWLEDDRAWQARCQEVEDRLSDALHARLTERFVTGRVRHVHVEGLPGATPPPGRGPGGRLEGLRYRADLGAPPLEGAPLLAVREELARRVARLEAAAPDALELDARGILRWEGGPLARLARGPAMGQPQAHTEPLPLLDEADRARVSAVVEAWLEGWLDALFAPLRRPARARLSEPAAAIADAVEAGLGAAPALRAPVDQLQPRDRRLLAKLDLRLGRHTIYAASMMEPAQLEARAQLWATHEGLKARPALPQASVTLRDPERPREFYEAIGYVVLGRHALRADEAEALAARARGLARRGGFRLPQRWIQRLGGAEAAGRVLLDLGFLPDQERPGAGTWRLARR